MDPVGFHSKSSNKGGRLYEPGSVLSTPCADFSRCEELPEQEQDEAGPIPLPRVPGDRFAADYEASLRRLRAARIAHV